MADESVVDPNPVRRRPYRPRTRVGDLANTGEPMGAVADILPVKEPSLGLAGTEPSPDSVTPDLLRADRTIEAVADSLPFIDVDSLEQASVSGPADRPSFDTASARETAEAPTTGTNPAPWRGGERGLGRIRGRGGPRPVHDRVPASRRDGAPIVARSVPPRSPNSVGSPPARPMRGVSPPYGSSLGRMPSPGESSTGFRSIGRSPEDIARLAQEARREARLNRGRMFRAAATGQSEPYRALGRGPTTAPPSGASGNSFDRPGNGGPRPPSRPGGTSNRRPPTGR